MTAEAVYSVIVPVFNEEEVLDELHKRLTAVMQKRGEPYEIIFVDDGSSDRSIEILKALFKQDKHIRIIRFSRNFGHQMAITAGLDRASGKAAIVIDADLQDPPEVIPKFIDKWREGFEVVYGLREKRYGESIFKKATAWLFYRLLRKLVAVELPLDVGDFRLIDRKVIDALRRIREQNRYMRGLTSWVGFKQAGVPYVRAERAAGSTKYSLRKMLKLAWDGVFSFSRIPVKASMYLGFLTASLSFLYLISIVFLRIFAGTSIRGWSSIMGIVLFLGGVQLISLGILGEYVGRISEDVRGRPLYIVREYVEPDSDD